MTSLGPATATSSVVTDAKRYLGVPYVWGGTSPAGFDCSGLIYYVFNETGHAGIGRTSEAQQSQGQAENAGSAQPGDLVFFSDNGSDWNHVGIYEGNGMMIDAPHTGAAVREEPVAGFAPYTQYESFGTADASAGANATTAAFTAQTAGLSLNPLSWLPSVPWMRVGLGLLGGLVILVGVLVTFRHKGST